MAQLPTLPLFRKDLIESGLRPRTFILRLAFGIGLFAVFAAVALPDLLALGPGIQSLGYGAFVFEPLVVYLFVSVALFMPAIAAGSIQDEEDRGSLEVLRTTALSDGEIVLEKFASAVMRMASCMLLSLPLFGVAYAYGGLDPSRVGLSFVALVMWTLQIGALCMLVSARYEEAQTAITNCYFWIVVLAVGNVIFGALTCGPGAVLTAAGVYALGIGLRLPWGAELAMQLVPFATVLFMLKLACDRLGQRGPRKRKNYVRHVRSTRSSAARARLGLPVAGLPEMRPVAWRACGGPRGEVVANPRSLIVWWILLVVATLAIQATGVNAIYWTIAPFVVALAGARSFSTERQNQTLAPLLATPIPTRSIMWQKATVVHKKIGWLVALILPVILLHIIGNKVGIWAFAIENRPEATWGMLYVLGMVVACPVLLITAGYLGLFIGLISNHGSRATFVAVAVISGWLVLPGLLFRPDPIALRAISPWGVMDVLHGRPGDTAGLWEPLLGSLILNGSIAIGCIAYYYLGARRRLGRAG